MGYFVYILRSLKDGRYYIGSTQNLERRIAEHNSGKTKSLRYRTPLELVYYEDCGERKLAYRREVQIKSYKGGNEFKKLIEKMR